MGLFFLVEGGTSWQVAECPRLALLSASLADSKYSLNGIPTPFAGAGPLANPRQSRPDTVGNERQGISLAPAIVRGHCRPPASPFSQRG